MKRTPLIHLLPFCLAVLLSAVGCSDSGSGDGTGQNNNNENNGTNNNGQNNENNGNNSNSCLFGAQCPSGICENGTCTEPTGQNNCDNPSPCGNCDPTCNRETIGGPDNPFVIDDNPDDDNENQGVILGPDGAITLDVRRVESNFIWIANTGQGTVSKVDTRTYEEIARYLTGPATNNDPSRTSVDTAGDVYVGNRGGMTVTKISTLQGDCPDTNNDGQITTSMGPNDVLDWGQDDCVLWNTDVSGDGVIRSVAAQDSVADAGVRITPGVWVGSWGGTVWKLDSATGDVLVQTESPVTNYGFALDGKGNLWISGWTNGAIGRIDTLRCTDSAACSAETVCDREDGDNCVKQRIPLPHRPYGLTVDFKQRVWAGGDNVTQYDPSKAVGSRLTHITAPFTHGIAADDKGFVWAAAMASGVIRYNADDPAQNTVVAGSEQSAKGMAIDLDGKIWSINRQDSSATVILPGATLNDHQVLANHVTGFVSPYTYSDMTGAQLRFATNDRGFYRRVYEGCTGSNVLETVWQELRWDAEIPGNSKLIFRGRTGETREDLADSEWIDLAIALPDTSPKDVSDLIRAANQQGAKLIELEAALESDRVDNMTVHVPKLMAMAVTFSCPVNIQ